MTINSNNSFASVSNGIKIFQNNANVENSSSTEGENTNKNDPIRLSLSSSAKDNLNKINQTQAQEEPVIQSRNKYEGELEIRIKIKNDYYAKVVEEDKKFDNPYGHIWDKYHNEYSPYYIEGLTDEERDAGESNEFNYLKWGKDDKSLTSGDAIFRDRGPLYADVESAKEKAFNREEVNKQVQQLLDANNITIPQNTKLRFTIDPNNYKVTVTGTDDKNLTSLLEKMLDEKNSKQLFYHISLSSSDDSTQFTKEKQGKYYLITEMKDKTGYDLNDLSVENGKFVTEDGTDIFDIYKESIRTGTSVPEQFKDTIIYTYGEELKNLAKVGIDSIPDLFLSIDYENGSFYDVGQSKNYGRGKTDWIDKLEASKE
ncbi:DUF4885 family protein [Arcobacter sp. F2176]|uniref:DUF4885 family protein n=1 Tax=Arcobacter sp. F2176 TaxID=2044511 RepID=UPI00100C3529|nr:DUF4885 family protein [Arcobacter sp. F2176]RXJ80209.1 DUF4885 domain-containing protein [Arcobacter sp. F2176]